MERSRLALALELHRPSGLQPELSRTAFAKSSETWIRFGSAEVSSRLATLTVSPFTPECNARF
jgi:hypothetical protein